MNSELQTRLLIASDDSIIREGLRSLFRQVAEVQIVGEAETIMETPRQVRELLPEVVLIEVGVLGRAHGLRAAR